MYDMEIAMPVDTGIKKINLRLTDFKKYGLQNLNGARLKLVLLAAKNNEVESLKVGWPDGIEIEIFETNYTHVAQRIYEYYASYLKPDTAKWYARIDEDTVTDVGGLLENMDRWFDWKEQHHATTGLNWDICSIDRNILKNMGYGHWYFGDVRPPHEQEASVTSAAAIKKTYSNPDTLKYFNLRKNFDRGWGDHGLCHCLRMNKIYPTPIHFLSHEPAFFNLSLFGGYCNHVHWICRDRCPHITEWMRNFTPAKNSPLADQIFIMGQNFGSKRWVKFNSKNGINNYDNNEAGGVIGLWSETGNDITIITDESNKKAVFRKKEDDLWLWDDFELRRM